MIDQLGIKVEDWTPDMRLEVRQKCFHLFWIPFFSLGKMYAVRKEGQLYNLSPELESVLRAQMPHKTPWYTYIGLLIVAVGFVLYTANEKYERYRSDKSIAELHATKHQILTNPIAGDQYTIETSRMPNTFYARVAEVKRDSVLLKIVKVERRDWGDFEPQLISFKDEDLKFAPQWTTIDEIHNAAPIEDYYCKDSLQLYLPELGGVTPYVVNQIERNGKEYW